MFVSLDKLYQIDIVYDFYDTLKKQRIESTELETAIEEAYEYLEDYKDDHVYDYSKRKSNNKTKSH